MRDRQPITLAYLDIDDFKALKDRLGHAAGDEALVAIARTINDGIRPEDMLARLGGDEFALLLPGPDYSMAGLALRRIRDATAEAMSRPNWKLTMSVGAVTFTGLSSSLSECLARADELMYEVKKEGKNAMRHIAWPS